jgi:hypothetical protein
LRTSDEGDRQSSVGQLRCFATMTSAIPCWCRQSRRGRGTPSR